MNYTRIRTELQSERERLRTEIHGLESELRSVDAALRAFDNIEAGIPTKSRSSRTPQQDRILHVLQEANGQPLKPVQIADLAGINSAAVGQLLFAMKKSGKLQYSRGVGYWINDINTNSDNDNDSDSDGIYDTADTEIHTPAIGDNNSHGTRAMAMGSAITFPTN